MLALVGLAAVEVTWRVGDFNAPMPYRLGMQEYRAVAHHVSAFGPADVAFIGSSRTREAIYVPEVKAFLQSHGHPEIAVANYACAGSTAHEVESFVRHLLRQEDRPRLLLYGMSPRQFLETGEPLNRAAVFWTLSDWREEFARGGWPLVQYLPSTFDNELQSLSVMYGRRHVLRSAIWHALGRTTSRCGPAHGEPSLWHQRQPNRSLITDPPNEAAIRAHLAELLRGRDYQANADRMASVQRVMLACRQAGVPLVLIEIPFGDTLKRLQPGALERFHQTMSELLRDTECDFATVQDLGVLLGDECFLDPFHLNRDGALTYTRAVSERVILPKLSGAVQGGPRNGAPDPRSRLVAASSGKS